MPNSCAAFNCTARKEKGGKVFHSFPLKDADLLKKWIVAMKREDFIPRESSRLCADHFRPSDYLFSQKN